MNLDTINNKIVEYNELVNTNLPFVKENSIWAQNKVEPKSFPNQGFKLHISATIKDCSDVLKITLNVLKKYDIVFKACKNSAEVKKLNNGLFYGESQIGKIITIYPYNPEQCMEIAETIHNLTEPYNYVDIPYDYQYKKNSNVFYRYGLFKENPKNEMSINDTIIKDDRLSRIAVPFGITNPLPKYTRLNKSLKSYLLMKAIIKRGKGSTFNALLIKNNDIKNCIIKEGIANGELYFDNIDGYKRIVNEESVLRKLYTHGISTPKVIDSFTLNKNRYLVLEQINGVSLTKYIKGRNKISFEEFLPIAKQITLQLKKIHRLKLIWRDCKPENIIYDTTESKLTCIDFEGCCRKNTKQLISWSSPGFTPPEYDISEAHAVTTKFDAYSLGCVLYFLITKEFIAKAADKYKLKNIKRKFPAKVIEHIIKMLDENPKIRPEVDVFYSMIRKPWYHFYGN